MFKRLHIAVICVSLQKISDYETDQMHHRPLDREAQDTRLRLHCRHFPPSYAGTGGLWVWLPAPCRVVGRWHGGNETRNNTADYAPYSPTWRLWERRWCNGLRTALERPQSHILIIMYRGGRAVSPFSCSNGRFRVVDIQVDIQSGYSFGDNWIFTFGVMGGGR